jgi:alpha-mannosidase
MTALPNGAQSKRGLMKYRLLVALAATVLAALVTCSWSCYSNRSKDDSETTTNLQLLFPSVSKLSADESERVLNVHVVPHTHDDVGWRKTVEQYYYGKNNSIDERGAVHSIISTVVESLLENSARTFTYVELKFFSMWWNEQGDAVKDSVRFLLANEQLFFVNGGWCMHDEAATHYMGMIDQTTLGHSFLLKELGVVPVVGWQLDPFGHSATQASLLTSRVGFDALYFGRIDYQDLALRQETSECEGVWEPSSNLENSEIFWGLTGSYHGNYGAPEGFCFDIACNDEPLVGANATRLMERLNMFLEAIRMQSDQTQGHNMMLTMGSDFQVRRKLVCGEFESR